VASVINLWVALAYIVIGLLNCVETSSARSISKTQVLLKSLPVQLHIYKASMLQLIYLLLEVYIITLCNKMCNFSLEYSRISKSRVSFGYLGAAHSLGRTWVSPTLTNCPYKICSQQLPAKTTKSTRNKLYNDDNMISMWYTFGTINNNMEGIIML